MIDPLFDKKCELWAFIKKYPVHKWTATEIWDFLGVDWDILPEEHDPGTTLSETIDKKILSTLEKNDWNQAKAARELGISRQQVNYYLHRKKI